ncbi:MAG: hypothetical protein M0Z95_05710 [Actinomycetota bacterium]|jgi:hypothetical protein|nr:hypothetical protein [Actinomycetota bacterium]
MNEHLLAHLHSRDPELLRYLDARGDISMPTAEQLYRYALALLQGLLSPAHVQEDWSDFYVVADAFILAYGSRRLAIANQETELLSAAADQAPPVSSSDQRLLVELVRELGAFVYAHASRSSDESSSQ